MKTCRSPNQLRIGPSVPRGRIGHQPRFELFHRLPAQGFECLNGTQTGLARNLVHHAECPQGNPIRSHQRNTGIKTEPGIGESFILGSIGNHQGFGPQNDVGGKGIVPRDRGCIQTGLRLEVLLVVVDETDGGSRGSEQKGGDRSDLV